MLKKNCVIKYLQQYWIKALQKYKPIPCLIILVKPTSPLIDPPRIVNSTTCIQSISFVKALAKAWSVPLSFWYSLDRKCRRNEGYHGACHEVKTFVPALAIPPIMEDARNQVCPAFRSLRKRSPNVARPTSLRYNDPR